MAPKAREINTMSSTSTRRNPRSISETKVCFLPSRSPASVCVSFARRRTAAKHAPTRSYCSGSIRMTGSISCWSSDPIGSWSRWAPMLEAYRTAGPERDRLPFLKTRQSGRNAAARGECFGIAAFGVIIVQMTWPVFRRFGARALMESPSATRRNPGRVSAGQPTRISADQN